MRTANRSGQGTLVWRPNFATAVSLLVDAFGSIVSGRFWKAKSLVAVLALAMLHAFPAYDAVRSEFVESTWRSVQVKFDHPFTDMAKAFPPASHEGKLTFRMTVPLLARTFHLGLRGILLFNGCLGVLLLYQVLALAHRLTADRTVAFWVCLAIACAWPGQTAFHEFRGGYYDAAALCALMLAMSARSAVAAWIWAFLAAWTDERSLVALPLVLTVSSHRAALLAAGGGYVLARIALATSYATPTEGIGLTVFLAQIATVPLGVWTGLGGGWILAAGSLIALLWRRELHMAAVLAAAFGPVILTAALVTDITRSAAYCLPGVFAALSILNGGRRLRTPAIVGASLSFLIPSYYVEGLGIYRLHFFGM